MFLINLAIAFDFEVFLQDNAIFFMKQLNTNITYSDTFEIFFRIDQHTFLDGLDRDRQITFDIDVAWTIIARDTGIDIARDDKGFKMIVDLFDGISIITADSRI